MESYMYYKQITKDFKKTLVSAQALRRLVVFYGEKSIIKTNWSIQIFQINMQKEGKVL